jgi:RNA polymerase sigma-70 factor (ECF subfamily)
MSVLAFGVLRGVSLVPVTRDEAAHSAVAPPSSSDVVEVNDRLRADVERAVRKVCPRWLVDQIDDLTQAATLRVVQRLRDTADTSVVFTSGYIYRAAYTALIDEIRRRRRLRETPIDPDLFAASQAERPDRRAASRAIREAVTKCLSALAMPRRRAVMLRLQGHSLDEMSALLDAPRKRVDNLLYRGLADLRLCLKSRGVEP